jgi:hypothetical protein
MAMSTKTAVDASVDALDDLDPGTMAIPGIYARWTLDCVVEAATAIAHDYRTRYRQYRGVNKETGRLLAAMKSKVGFDPDWPNKDQRTAINAPLVGMSDAESSTDMASPFCEAAQAVRTAAVAYSERVYDTGEPMLRQAFVDSARHFRAYLLTFGGSVVVSAQADTLPMFQKSAEVLSAVGVAPAFGLPSPPQESWPLPKPLEDRSKEYLNGDGAYLVDEVSRVLQEGKGITQQQFLSLQRAAAAGARTIHFVLRQHHELGEKDPKLSGLIGDAYSWATALRDLEVEVSQVK